MIKDTIPLLCLELCHAHPQGARAPITAIQSLHNDKY